MKVYNATRHVQRKYKKQWDEWGIIFVPTSGAQLGSVQPKADPESLRADALDAVERAKFAGADAILIGGISSLAAMISIAAVDCGLRIIEPKFSGKDNNENLVLIGYRDVTPQIRSLMGLLDQTAS